jgi:hypothetical protein
MHGNSQLYKTGQPHFRRRKKVKKDTRKSGTCIFLRLEGFSSIYSDRIPIYLSSFTYLPGGTVPAAVDLLKELGAEISQIRILRSLGKIVSPDPFV